MPVPVFVAFLVAVLVLGLAASALSAQEPPFENLCNPTGEPGATLLVPYFEVDLDDPEGVTTFFSVANAADDPILAHVVIWSDWAFPVLAFDVHLEANAVQPIDLRTLLVGGRLPARSAPDAGQFPGCGGALPATVGESELAFARSRLTGRPDPDDGLCYSRPRPGSQRAVGFVTVDVVGDCSGPSLRYPSDPGYFAEDGSGLARNDNVLWGDVVYLAARDNSAQGVQAVAIRADPEHFAADPYPYPRTFYFAFARGRDSRYPLGSSYRFRTLSGGAFEGGTEAMVWMDGFAILSDGRPCDEPTFDHDFFINVREGAEDGRRFERETLQGGTDFLAVASKMAVREGEALAPSVAFGWLQLEMYWTDIDVLILPEGGPIQGWVIPILKAGGRYSVGLDGTRVPVQYDVCE